MVEQENPNIRKGIITRVGYDIGYLKDKQSGEDFGFIFANIEGYAGQYPNQIGLVEGTDVDFIPPADPAKPDLVESLSFPFVDKRPKLFGRWVLPWAINS